jgi:hypothetical protein
MPLPRGRHRNFLQAQPAKSNKPDIAGQGDRLERPPAPRLPREGRTQDRRSRRRRLVANRQQSREILTPWQRRRSSGTARSWCLARRRRSCRPNQPRRRRQVPGGVQSIGAAREKQIASPIELLGRCRRDRRCELPARPRLTEPPRCEFCGRRRQPWQTDLDEVRYCRSPCCKVWLARASNKPLRYRESEGSGASPMGCVRNGRGRRDLPPPPFRHTTSRECSVNLSSPAGPSPRRKSYRPDCPDHPRRRRYRRYCS